MNDDTARAKFFAIQALRLSGLGLVMVGLLIVNGVIDLPEMVGYMLFVVGLLDALIMPGVLSRMWKSPPP
ncbi:MAG: hypothetical protein KDE55_12975 [Novosphingobium sp.]|nr:hypothetical protein [Novosphingobium sp.]